VPAVLASFFGSGLVLGRIRGNDAGSGTIGALVAGLIAYVLPPIWGRLTAFVVVVVLGLWATSRLGLHDDDPGWVVIDEAAGTFLATVGLGPMAMIVAFVVFRAADIGKRWFPGVAAAESIGGPVGIMADDVLAGIYGLAAGWLFQATVF